MPNFIKRSTPILSFILFVTVAIGFMTWSIQDSFNNARAQAIQEAVPPIKAFLFPNLVTPLDPYSASANEAQLLTGIFYEAESALNTGLQNTTNAAALRREIEKATIDELENFVGEHAQSLWTPSLRNNLGDWYRKHGLTTKALAHLEAAWDLTKNIEAGEGKRQADFAFAWWTRLLVIYGRTETLTNVFGQYGVRILDGGPLSQVLARTHEKHGRMIRYPQHSYKCGIYALDQLAKKLELTYPRETLIEIPGTPAGFTLRELETIATEYQFGMRAVRRAQNSGAIPVPSIVHWNQEHFATIVARRGDIYQINDPSAAGMLFLTAEEINAEATGYFLVPNNLANGDFSAASVEESTLVVGRSSSCPPEDYQDMPCKPGGSDGGGGDGPGPGNLVGSSTGAVGVPENCGTSGCGGGGDSGGCCEGEAEGEPSNPSYLGSHGMPTWRVSEPYINLWVRDTPISYRPSKGPIVELTLNNKQRVDINFSTLFPFGHNWLSTWQSKITLQGADFADIYIPGEGIETLEFPSGVNMSYPLYLKNWTIERIPNGGGSITGMVAHLPNGMEYRYFHNVSGEFYLSHKVDPSGNKLTFNYDGTITDRLASITDADGNNTTLTYTTNHTPSTHFEVAIATPDSKTATIYVSTGYKLEQITDAAGIVTTFTYDGWGWMSSMTTPYGTTTFTHDYNAGWVDRSSIVTLPTGGWYVYMLLDDASTNQVPHSFLSGQIPTNTPAANGTASTLDTTHRHQRNSFRWNPAQFATCSTTNLPDLVWSDFKKANINHWLQRLTDYSVNHTGPTLALSQLPSPDGTTEGQTIWYDHMGKSAGSIGLQGSQISPAVVAKVQPDGSTHWTWRQQTAAGIATNVIEKWVENGTDKFRTNMYTYAGNGIDLIEHRFKASGLNKLVAGYGYDAYHMKTSMTNALNEVATWTYNGNHKLVTYQTPSGMVSSNTYGGDGYVSKTVIYENGGGPISTNQYTWSGGNLSTHTDPRGLATTHTWDGLNRLTKIDYPDGSFIQHAYTNGLGTMLLDRTYTQDRMGNITRWTYTPNRRVERIVNPLNITNLYTYCECGALESLTRAYGTSLAETTDYFYDNQMRLTEVNLPDGSWKTNAYDALGRLAVTGDLLGSVTNSYDNISRLVATTNAFGQVLAAVYDAEGNATGRTDANGVTVTTTYDALDRVLTRTYPDTGMETFSYTTDVRGPTSYQNQLSKTTTYAYDKLGRKTNEVVVGLTVTNSFTYNPGNDLLTLTDGKGQTTTWGYNVYGYVVSKQYANGTTNLVYAYDASGRLTNRNSTAKGDTKYAYDAGGNLTNIDYAASADVQFKYDALNRSTNEIVVGTFTNNFTYHPGGAIATEDGPWVNDTVTYGYNLAGLRNALNIQQPTGSFTNGYTYDAARRLSALTSHAGKFDYDYYPTNGGFTAPTHLVRKLTQPYSGYVTNSFDNNARELRTQLFTSGNVERNDHEYVYNVGNQRTKQTRTDDSHVTYTYDDASQLRTAYTTNSSGSETTAQRYLYGYDAAWNMIKRTNNATVTTYTVNNLNQNTTTWTFDSNGNPTYAGYICDYDDENRLIRVTSSSSWKIEYFYDARGRLRRRTEYSWTGVYWAGPLVDTRCVYDGMLVIQERDNSNTPSVTYTRGTDLGGTIQSAGGIGGMLARSSSYTSGSFTNHLFYHADAGGNITYLMMTNQTIGASYRYDPFGRTITSSGTFATANTYRFSSKEIQPNTAFYYYGYRFYDPITQRWLNRDPKGEGYGRNLYGAFDHDPLSKADPWGDTCGDWEEAGRDPSGHMTLVGPTTTTVLWSIAWTINYRESIPTISGRTLVCVTPVAYNLARVELFYLVTEIQFYDVHYRRPCWDCDVGFYWETKDEEKHTTQIEQRTSRSWQLTKATGTTTCTYQ